MIPTPTLPFPAARGFPTGVLPAVVLLGSLIGANTVLGKGLVAAGHSPLSLLAWQQLAAAVLAIAVLAWRREAFVFRPDVLRYGLAIGTVSLALPSLLGFIVMPHVGAGLFAATMTLSPLATFALRWTLVRRYPGHRRFAGLVVGGAGAWVLVATMVDGAPEGGARWALAALACPLLLATGNLLRERLLPDGVSGWQLAAAQPASVGTLLLPVAAATATPIAHPAIPFAPGDALLLAQAALGFAAQPLFFHLQRRADAIAISQIGYVAVVAGVLVAALLYGERPSPLVVLAVALLFAGLRVGHVPGGTAAASR